MSIPILATKLYIPPPRPKIVPRPALIENLNAGLSAGRKLTLISAPAGFGKTTLTSEWLADWLNSGWLAEAAIQGFVEAPKYGTYNIKKIVLGKKKEAKKFETVLQY